MKNKVILVDFKAKKKITIKKVLSERRIKKLLNFYNCLVFKGPNHFNEPIYIVIRKTLLKNIEEYTHYTKLLAVFKDYYFMNISGYLSEIQIDEGNVIYTRLMDLGFTNNELFYNSTIKSLTNSY